MKGEVEAVSSTPLAHRVPVCFLQHGVWCEGITGIRGRDGRSTSGERCIAQSCRQMVKSCSVGVLVLAAWWAREGLYDQLCDPLHMKRGAESWVREGVVGAAFVCMVQGWAKGSKLSNEASRTRALSVGGEKHGSGRAHPQDGRGPYVNRWWHRCGSLGL